MKILSYCAIILSLLTSFGVKAETSFEARQNVFRNITLPKLQKDMTQALIEAIARDLRVKPEEVTIESQTIKPRSEGPFCEIIMDVVVRSSKVDLACRLTDANASCSRPVVSVWGRSGSCLDANGIETEKIPVD